MNKTIFNAVKIARRRPKSGMAERITNFQASIATNPVRCSLPKKKQRELGMLPPVTCL